MSVSEPGKIITPWAESGLKNPIPPAANPATGRAGFDQGFSAINMTAKEAGGIPPFGQDFNGIFYEVTNILRYMQAGGQPTFDAALATAIGGYPYGAMIVSDDGGTLFINSVDSNSNNPNTSGAGWYKLFDVTYSPANEANSFSTDFNIVIGDKALPFGASNRDAFQVSRYINGKTDCHAFADKTTILNATDLGTYGTFDSETEVSGSHTQSHQFSFQDRSKYSGSGTLQNWGNIIWPEKNGTGTVTQRTDIEIKDVAGSGGSITSHTGLYIRDLVRAASNVALNIEQSAGYAYYAPNSGRLFSKGRAGFGVDNASAGEIVRISNDNGTTIGFMTADAAAGATFGVVGDKEASLTANGARRLIVKSAAVGQNAVVPGADNTQPLGDVTARWKQLYAGTATINTSDMREKTDVRELLETERRVSQKVRGLFRAYKLIDAVAGKGDEARWHFGVMAQEVIAAFQSEGLDPFAYGAVCYDEWPDIYRKVLANEGETVTETMKVERQVVDIVKERIINERVVQVDGAFVLEQFEEDIEMSVPRFDVHPVYLADGSVAEDADGNPRTVSVPVMETIEVPRERPADPVYVDVLETPAGNRYGIRYEELYAFVIAAM